MRVVFDITSLSSDIRAELPNGVKFNVCEDCNNENYEEFMNIKFYVRYRLALCDACVDCRDGLKWAGKKDYSVRLRKLAGVGE